MSTVGNLAITLSDYRKRMLPDGTLDPYIVEVLHQSNPMLDKIKWIEGNLPTGTQVTQWSHVPEPSIRVLNDGVPYMKGETKQITDTCMILEGRSRVDIEVLALQKNKEAFRRSEDTVIIEGFSQKAARMFIYGDIAKDASEFNGFAVRYNTLVGDKNSAGYQVISAGTPNAGALNTSAFLIGFGERASAGVYPLNTEMGLKRRDLGEQRAEGPNGPFQALETLFNWKLGLTVKDIRQNARICNIDVTKLPDITSAAGKELINKFVRAKNRIRNLSQVGTDFGWYVDDNVVDFLECYLIDKNNVHVTRQELMGKMPQLYVAGIPVYKMDAITATETAIV